MSQAEPGLHRAGGSIWSCSRPRPWSSACKNPSASHPCLPLFASRDLGSFSLSAGGSLGAKISQGRLLKPSPQPCAWICSKCLALLPWAQGSGPALLCMYQSSEFPSRALRHGFLRKQDGCDSGDLSWLPSSPLLVPLDLLACLGKGFQSWDKFLEGGGWIEIALLP